MINRFRELMARIEELHDEIERELAAKQEEFRYTIEKGRIRFQQAAQRYHRTIRLPVLSYLKTAPLLYVLTAPFIYICIVPMVLLDVAVTLYQTICFPVYNIPKVKRSDYIKLDRHKLHYLNILQKINCEYCSYGVGVLAYASEIASRTELFWCPIKHAKTPKAYHERYAYFIDYGDADNFDEKLNKVREKCRACEGCEGGGKP